MTPTTETLKAIAMLRESFPMGSEQWWDCVRWQQAAIAQEREQRAQEATGDPATNTNDRNQVTEDFMRPDEFTPVWPGQAGQTPVARPEAAAVRQYDLMVIAVFLGSAVGAVLGVVLGR